ncbi:class I SAM-dependent methyltransferase [Amycolatopsis thermoflava]|uniref:class I SAM-dependent methyltransferase n=1 Tax=Amycolatopsis thermoflava TaxID=84480 RepID=UPI0036613D32
MSLIGTRLRSLARRYAVSRRTHEDLLARCAAAEAERDQLAATYRTWVPPGHFYSPQPDPAQVLARAGALFDTAADPVGLDLREDDQLALLPVLTELLKDHPFPEDRSPEYRYFFGNPEYSWSDALVLHGMLRHLRPRRLIEIGSGYSSAMTLDTVEHWLDGAVELTFVEPHPELLRSLLRPGDEQRVTVREQPVQDVPLEAFLALEAGDVLFIDSTHVVKAGSDVNHLFFEVLPRLADGVWVHVHDVFFPFEYPLEWVTEGRAWQEVYLLRAFLTYNPRFEVRWFQQYLWARHRELLTAAVPDMARNPGGNIWLRKAPDYASTAPGTRDA